MLSLQREQPLFLHPGPLFVSILSHIRGFSFTVREQADPVSSQPGLQNPIAAFLSTASPGDGGLQLLSVGRDHLEDYLTHLRERSFVSRIFSLPLESFLT